MKLRRFAHHEKPVTLADVARKDRHNFPALEVFRQNTPRSR